MIKSKYKIHFSYNRIYQERNFKIGFKLSFKIPCASSLKSPCGVKFVMRVIVQHMFYNTYSEEQFERLDEFMTKYKNIPTEHKLSVLVR